MEQTSQLGDTLRLLSRFIDEDEGLAYNDDLAMSLNYGLDVIESDHLTGIDCNAPHAAFQRDPQIKTVLSHVYFWERP